MTRPTSGKLIQKRVENLENFWDTYPDPLPNMDYFFPEIGLSHRQLRSAMRYS